MPICQNCHKQWSWKQTVKKMFTLATGIECPYCGNTQFLTTRSRIRSSIIAFFAPSIMLLNIFVDLSLVAALILLGGSFIAAIAMYPFLIELTDEEEPLW